MVTDEVNEHKAISKKQLTAIIGLFLLAAIVASLRWRRKNMIIHGKYKDLIAKISAQQSGDILKLQTSAGNNEMKTSSITITDETLKTLLFKLEKFEASKKYLRKDLSLTWMASNLGTNTKYLSEVIKIIKTIISQVTSMSSASIISSTCFMKTRCTGNIRLHPSQKIADMPLQEFL